jgi:hypothetical protein
MCISFQFKILKAFLSRASIAAKILVFYFARRVYNLDRLFRSRALWTFKVHILFYFFCLDPLISRLNQVLERPPFISFSSSRLLLREVVLEDFLFRFEKIGLATLPIHLNLLISNSFTRLSKDIIKDFSSKILIKNLLLFTHSINEDGKKVLILDDDSNSLPLDFVSDI